MLNKDDPAVRELARASRLFHLKLKVPCATTEKESFLEFAKKNNNGKLDINVNASGFGVRSKCLDLNDIATAQMYSYGTASQD